MNRNYNILKILKSCVTDVAVWIYRGPSKESARRAYYRACKLEAERMRRVSKALSRRKSNIMRLLNDCLSSVPVTGELDQRRKQAARLLVSISEDGGALADRSFYNHVLEERRRRRKARGAGRKNEPNRDYDK